jgi:cell division protein FtsQ
MFGGSKRRRRRRRRSELRLGAPTITYETTATRPAFSVTPVLKFWQKRGAKISGVVVLALLMWAVYTIFATPTYYVYGADIRGNSAVSTLEIYTVSGIDSQSIFWINPAEVNEKITALPNIKSAEVSVSLPARVTINVVERRPQLLWQVDDKAWWVDEEGTVVPPRSNLEGMLRIIDDDRTPVEVGYQIDQTIIKGAQALRILAPDVNVIRHTRALGLIVATPEGWPVYLGDGSEMRAKIVVLSTLMANLREKGIAPSYIDLRNPMRPVYRELPVIQIAPPSRVQPPPGQPAPPAFR